MNTIHVLWCGICGADFTSTSSVRFIPTNNTGHYEINSMGIIFSKVDSTFDSTLPAGKVRCSYCHHNTLTCVSYHAFRVSLDDIPLLIHTFNHDQLSKIFNHRLEFKIESLYPYDKGFLLPGNVRSTMNNLLDIIFQEESLWIK